jgi:hypothetical protein
MPQPGRGGGGHGDGHGPGRDRPERSGGGGGQERPRPEPQQRQHDEPHDPPRPEQAKDREKDRDRRPGERQGRDGERGEREQGVKGADRGHGGGQDQPGRGRDERPGRAGPQAPAPGKPGRREDPAVDDGPAGPPKTSIEVGATENKPELVETLAIGTQPGQGTVVLSLGPETKTETPLPDLAPGDRLLALAELELTTDADDPNHPGLVGNAYSYAPNVTARLVLDDIELSKSPWTQAVTHQRHHAVVTFGDGEARIPDGWKGAGHVNLVVDVSHPDAQPGDVILVGQNEKTPTVVQDMAGIRVVRFRPGDAREPAPETQSSCLCSSLPIAKQETVVLSHELADPQAGERLLVRGALVTNADGLAAPARISTRMFIAEGPDQTEPGGAAAADVTWKGHLSKFTGFNCVPGEGAQTSRKYGVAAVRQAPGRSLYVNLVAVSAAPFGGNAPTDELPVDTGASWLRVTRFSP